MQNENTPAEGLNSAQLEAESALRGAACSADLIERIAKDSFRSPFVVPYTSELKRVLDSPTGSMCDTMIGDLYKQLVRLYSSMPNSKAQKSEVSSAATCS